MNAQPINPNCIARTRGYVLLEIIIALTVFAVVVTGLAGLLHSTLDASNQLRRHASIRRGMEAILAEAQEKKKQAEMIISFRDESLGVEFRSSLEEVKWINRTGQPVKGLYLLTAVANDLQPGRPPQDRAEVYDYRP